MSYEPQSGKNKHPKAHFEQYLYNLSEPEDDLSKDVPLELETKLSENSQVMRRHFRHAARSMKSRY